MVFGIRFSFLATKKGLIKSVINKNAVEVESGMFGQFQKSSGQITIKRGALSSCVVGGGSSRFWKKKTGDVVLILKM